MSSELPLHSVFISHAWGGISDEVTEALTAKFKQKNIPYILDKNHLGYRGSIQEFMIQLGKAEMVIIILSNKYLQSEYCMFELIQIYKNDRLRDRIFPIVLDEVQISKSTDRLELVKYWEDQITQLQSKLKELNSLSHIEGITDDLNLYTEIRNNIAKLTSILRDINSLNLRMHSDGDFEILCQSILTKLNKDSNNVQNTLDLKEPKLLNSIHTSKVWIKWAGLAFVAVFLLLGLGKFIFGKESKEQTNALAVKMMDSTLISDSIKSKIEYFISAGNLYSPDKECAWKSYRQLEKLFPDNANLSSLKTELVSKMVGKTNELLATHAPFDAQLLVQKIHELDPANQQSKELVNRINKEKEDLAKIPKTETKTIPTHSKESNTTNSVPIHKSVGESVGTKSENPIHEVDKEIKPSENPSASKAEHKTRKVTIPANTELILATNQEFNSEENLQLNKLYYFRVAKPLLINGVVAITLGEKAEMKLTKIKRSDYKRGGSMEFVISKVILADGTGLNLKSSNFLLKADGDIPLVISKGQQFKVKTAQALTIEK